MLNFCSLYSSSEGNSLFVQNNNTSILVDVGVSSKKIESALSSIKVNIHDISAILITHEHSDHIKGLSTISKKYNIPVYANQETWSFLPKDNIKEENQKIFSMYEDFSVGDLHILPFKIPHDATCPSGFNISYKNTKLSIATDLGHITPEIFNLLERSAFIMLESNYDPEVLKCSSYPYSLKNRISGPNGHLSNELAGQAISKLIHSGLRSAMLGHLSKNTNFPELAYSTVVDELNSCNIDSTCIDLAVANRLEPSKVIEIA